MDLADGGKPAFKNEVESGFQMCPLFPSSLGT